MKVILKTKWAFVHSCRCVTSQNSFPQQGLTLILMLTKYDVR